MYFRNYGLPKAGLDKYLKSDVSQFPSTGNTRNALKHISNRGTAAPLPYLLITAKDIQFEKVTLSDMVNLKTVC